MAPINAFSQARAAFWANDNQQALEIATEARNNLSHPWLNVLVTNALLAMGQYETARSESSLFRTGSFLEQYQRFVVAAAAGDRDRAKSMQENILSDPDASDFERLQTHAMLGEREEANAAAARIDQRARIPISLMLVTLWCSCGAPFDLEAAPNLAAKLQEGDLPWPPPSPINFPLKDW